MNALVLLLLDDRAAAAKQARPGRAILVARAPAAKAWRRAVPDRIHAPAPPVSSRCRMSVAELAQDHKFKRSVL